MGHAITYTIFITFSNDYFRLHERKYLGKLVHSKTEEAVVEPTTSTGSTSQQIVYHSCSDIIFFLNVPWTIY